MDGQTYRRIDFINFSIFPFRVRLQHLGSVIIYHRNLTTDTTAGRMERSLMSIIRFEFLKMRAFSMGQQIVKLEKLVNPAR